MTFRVLAGTVILLVAAASAVLEVLYLPLRTGLVPIPLSVLAAVVLNVIFTRTMYIVTGSIVAALLPGAAWLAVVARAATARPEGDLLITDGASTSRWVNLCFMYLGAIGLVFAVATLRRHMPRDRAKPKLGVGRHTRRRWLRGRSQSGGSHSAPAGHRRPPRSLAARPAEVSQPPETAGIT